jgi:hypothetical protein
MEKNFKVAQIKSALSAIRSKISEPQMSMLRAHYLYRTLSMARIALFGGYGQYRAGNLQYGLLCGRLARELAFDSPGDKTYTIASVTPERDGKGHFQWRMDDVVAKALEELGWAAPVPDVGQEPNEPGADDEGATETERKALIDARVGQGTFRTGVISVWGRCAVTGCSLQSVLVASHIVPWKQATNAERLDPFNGLLLTPNLDRLLDHCLISFKDDGSMLLSKDLSAETMAVLGVSEKSKLRFVRPAALPYLRRHRKLFLQRERRQ